MSGQIRQFIAERWRFGTVQSSVEKEELIRILNNRLGKLSETLERLHASLENGPVPGAYLTFPLYCDTPDIEDGIAYTYPPQSYQGLRIIGMAASISDQSDASASLDIEVEYKNPNTSAWATILTTSTQTVTAASPVLMNSAGDFVLSYFPVGGFRVNCTDMTNIPKGLMVLLYVKNVGRIEPVTT